MGNKQMQGTGDKGKKNDRYAGEMKHNQAHGRGKLVYSAKDKEGRATYEGHFVAGHKQGEGIMTWTDGRVYMGGWVADDIEGKGTMLYDADRSARAYVGEWVAGQRDGMGRMTYAADDEHGRVSYFGPWAADKQEGNGLMEWRSGAKYLGEWRRGKRHGHGVFMFPSGDQLVSSQWCDGRPQGVVKMIYADGHQCDGFWLNADTWENTRTLVFKSLSA
jgi:hypothetical protein